MRELTREKLKVRIFETRSLMGIAAAEALSQRIRELLETKEFVNIIFAAAPSQNEFLAELKGKDVDWNRINAFHMDEYVGLNRDAPQGFGNFLKERLFEKVPLREVHYLNGNATDLEQECKRYAELLDKNPTDIVCLGIGENTHLAFNTLDEVPTHALTITIPALFKADYAYAVVPGELKANAIYHTLNSKMDENYPSTILRKHKNAVLFIDEGSATRI